MAKLVNGILGGFKGRLGPAVGYFLRDEPHVRALPRGKQFTAAERLNHQKFKMVQEYLMPIKDLVKVGFKNYYTSTGGYRAAVAYTRKEALISDGADFYIEPSRLKISGGTLPPAINPQLNFTGPSQLQITWDSAGTYWRNYYDQLLVLVYDMERFETVEIVLGGPFRKDGECRAHLPEGWAGRSVHVYIGFVSASREQQSESQYLGSHTIPFG